MLTHDACKPLELSIYLGSIPQCKRKYNLTVNIFHVKLAKSQISTLKFPDKNMSFNFLSKFRDLHHNCISLLINTTADKMTKPY